jgi:hypothetical protein
MYFFSSSVPDMWEYLYTLECNEIINFVEIYPLLLIYLLSMIVILHYSYSPRGLQCDHIFISRSAMRLMVYI